MKYTRMTPTEMTRDQMVERRDTMRAVSMIIRNRMAVTTQGSAKLRKLFMRIVLRALAWISTPYIRPKGVGFSSSAMPCAKGPTMRILFPSALVDGHLAGSGEVMVPA